MSTAWKSFERWVCRLFRTERNPLSGGNGKHSRSDSLHPDLFLSCKHTRSNHKSLFRLAAEETEKAVDEQKIPVIIIGKSGRGTGKRLDNSLCIIPMSHLAAFQEWCRSNPPIEDD